MVKIPVFFLLLFTVVNVNAQKNHFIAVQSENKQPFYAKVRGEVLNSTPTGHLIIPKLADSTYIVTIGFTKSLAAEEQFSIAMTKDLGFILRIGKDKELVLSNSQTGQVAQLMKHQPDNFITYDSGAVAKKDNRFSRLMAQVVNDSAVMENMYVAEEPQKEKLKTESPKLVLTVDSSSGLQQKKNNETAKIKTLPKEISSADSSVGVRQKKKEEDTTLHKKTAVKVAEKKQKLIQPVAQKPIVTKLFEQKNDSSFQLVYEDVEKTGKRDTIDILIPVDSMSKPSTSSVTGDKVKKEAIIAETIHKRNRDSAISPLLGNPVLPRDSAIAPRDEKSSIRAGTKNVKKDSSALDTAKITLFRPLKTNINCRNSATDYDVDKLRIKIMAIEDEDDKISTAKKAFKTKCFSTNQIKALSEIFSNDAGKYKLFDAAYSYVYDVNNFTSLQSLLKDDYYISRFKAMIR